MEIKKNHPLPIYQQIIYSITEDINYGVLKCGDQLPSVRSLSSECDINPNTVLKAYEQLIKEGYVEARKGKGYYVSSNVKENVAEYHLRYIRQSLVLIKASAKMGDISFENIFGLMKDVWNEVE